MKTIGTDPVNFMSSRGLEIVTRFSLLQNKIVTECYHNLIQSMPNYQME